MSNPMMFDVRLVMREKRTGVNTEVDTRLQVSQAPEGYRAYNYDASPIVGKGATPQAAMLNYLDQQLHSVEALAMRKE